MKKIKAYTLIEMLVVMTVMIIILGVGISSYVAYIETTKYNQDVTNLQHDIITMQRASMLFKKQPEDGWVYGIGIDFGNMMNADDRDGTYKFFKWCSGYENYGPDSTTGICPNFDGENCSMNYIPNYTLSSCEGPFTDPPNEQIVALSGYGIGRLNLEEDVVVSGGRFLVFESVTGRAFIFDSNGALVTNNLSINFLKRRGTINVLEVEYLSGRTKLYSTGLQAPEEMDSVNINYEGGGDSKIDPTDNLIE